MSNTLNIDPTTFVALNKWVAAENAFIRARLTSDFHSDKPEGNGDRQIAERTLIKANDEANARLRDLFDSFGGALISATIDRDTREVTLITK